MEERKTYTIEAKPGVEGPEDWGDVLRPFKGVRLDPSSNETTGYFEATDDAIKKINLYLEKNFEIREI